MKNIWSPAYAERLQFEGLISRSLGDFVEIFIISVRAEKS